jgi:hypothetical protein
MLPLHCLRRYQAWTAESKICEQFKSDVQHLDGYVRLGNCLISTSCSSHTKHEVRICVNSTSKAICLYSEHTTLLGLSDWTTGWLELENISDKTSMLFKSTQ